MVVDVMRWMPKPSIRTLVGVAALAAGIALYRRSHATTAMTSPKGSANGHTRRSGLFGKSLTTALNVFSSGATNGVQTLIVAGASVPELLFVLEPLVVDADDFFELPQPLAVSTSASSSRTVPSTRFIRPPPIWLGFRTRF